MNGPAVVEVLRRVARGELFVQNRGSDVREDLSGVAGGRRESGNRIAVILSVGEDCSEARPRGDSHQSRLRYYKRTRSGAAAKE